MSATEILEQFRKLSREQQRELLERIREEVGDLDDELTLEQLAELERRAEEFRKDPHLGIPWEQVRDEVRKRFGWK
jgi:putative addiction module component (TIGR02574 family)